MEHHPYRNVSRDCLSSLEESQSSSLDISDISEEELQRELSFLGYPQVPQEVILKFKEDLVRLMRKGITDISRSSKETDPVSKPLKERSLAGWATPSSFSSLDNVGHYSKHNVNVGGRGLGILRTTQPLTRKVLRRTSNGQIQVTDESSMFSESEERDSQISEGPSAETCHQPSADYTKSFIRPPSYSLLDQYRQRSDPVGRYQEYKQSWDAIQRALERSRKDLRWEIREQMICAPPQPLPRPLPAINTYVVPTEKKRYGLRWAIRKDLVNGIMPRASYS
ncbi:centriolar and ciliogenesis-associated protein HYLS1 [Pelobates fuscus]|uniref:centriolar and ciliogenesis-associated protein HYLS1 n=1 Tax=Pelobates fuscus TaxID=191477 RepID=UPI002FE4A454